MHLPQSSEGVVTAVLATRRAALQPALISCTPSVLSKRGFTWGNCHKWTSKGNNMDRKALKEKIIKSSPYYPYLEHKMFTRRFLAAQGWRSSSQWKNSAANHNKDKEPDRTSSDSQQGLNSEDWLSAWQLKKIQDFEAFKRKIDADPYSAIFGNSSKILRWASEATADSAAKRDEQANASKQETDNKAKHDNVNKMNDVDENPFPNKKENESSQLYSKSERFYEDIEENEYDIDPITLRKIAKKESQASFSKETLAKNAENEFDIPVKTFKSSPSTSSLPSKGHARTQVDDWLGREGFGSATNTAKKMSPNEYGTSINSDLPKSKIQTSLDRHVEENGFDTKKHGAIDKAQTQKADEARDMSKESGSDALFSMKSGHTESHPASPSSRQELEDRYENREQDLREESQRDELEPKHVEPLLKQTVDGDSTASSNVSEALEAINDRYLNESLDSTADTGKSDGVYTTPSSDTVKAEKLSSFGNNQTRRIQTLLGPLKTQIDLMTADYEALRRKWLEETRRLRVKEAKKVEKQSKLLNQEIEAQKVAMKAAEEFRREDVSSKDTQSLAVDDHGEGDVSPNVGEFTSRDRYYKRKAPHANCEMDAKMQKLAKEKALVSEIRGIYEDAYGTIDTKHRQEQLPGGEGDMSPGVVDITYPDGWYKRQAPSAVDEFVSSGSKTGGKNDASAVVDTNTPQGEGISAEGDMSPNVVNLAYPNRWYKRHAPFTIAPFILSKQRAASKANDPTVSNTMHSPEHIVAEGDMSPSVVNFASSSDKWPKRSEPHNNPASPATKTAASKSYTLLKDDPSSAILTKTTTDEPALRAQITSLHSQLTHQSAELKHLRRSLRSKQHLPPPPNPIPAENAPKSDAVRRTEPVFSGHKSGPSKKEKRRAARLHRRAAFRHVLLTGLVTAGCCYAVGVVVEAAKAGVM